MVVLETGGGKVSSRGFDTLPRFGQKIVKMHTLVTTTALNIITLFKTKENARRLVLSRLLAITDRHELNFKLHNARAWSVLNRFHSWIPERPLGISFL